MKRILSVLMAAVMALTCLGIGSFSASASDTTDILKMLSSAEKISLGETKTVSLNSQSSKFTETIAMLKIIPTATGWYEFICDTKPETGDVASLVLNLDEDSDEDIYSGIGMAGRSAETEEFKVGARLTANKTYYLMLTGDECGTYTTNVTMAKHTHQYDAPYASSAYYEYDSEYKETYAWDGGKFQPCLYCGYEKTIEAYYAPKTMTIGYTSCVYTGKAKTPKVTVKDKKGNVIPASNYKVTYKNNVKPGKATVTVKFNGKKYDGVMTKTYIIKPKKAALRSISSPKSKQLTVKWTKDLNSTGYQIQYSTSSKFTAKTTKNVKVANAKSSQKTIGKLTGGKKYYVRVRYYKTISGKNYYGAWSASKAIKVKK